MPWPLQFLRVRRGYVRIQKTLVFFIDLGYFDGNLLRFSVDKLDVCRNQGTAVMNYLRSLIIPIPQFRFYRHYNY